MPLRLNLRAVLPLLSIVAVVVVVLLVRDPREETTPATEETTSAATPTAASTEDFCVAFYQLAELHGLRVADETPEAEGLVNEQGLVVLEVGRRLPVPQDIKNGLEGFVQDLLREPVTASREQLSAFSAWLPTACPG